MISSKNFHLSTIPSDLTSFSFNSFQSFAFIHSHPLHSVSSLYSFRLRSPEDIQSPWRPRKLPPNSDRGPRPNYLALPKSTSGRLSTNERVLPEALLLLRKKKKKRSLRIQFQSPERNFDNSKHLSMNDLNNSMWSFNPPIMN